jgi:hypothetical protein
LRGGALSVAPACVVLYLAVVLALLLAILHRDGGVFTYTLDDPYIHLALAGNLADGHYGINPGEASSPSSSIVWPFLLVPAAGSGWGMFLPLAWNVLFCAIAAWLLGRMVDGWAQQMQGRPAQGNAANWSWLARFAVAVGLMLVANLAGLTFVGMEHGLQVLLAITCAAGIMEAFAGRRISAWCLCAAVLGPMVRYENFALVLAVAVALYGQGRWQAAARVVALSLVGPALFSIFLVSRGLPALPSSMLVKARVYSFAGGGAISVLRSMYWGEAVGTMREPAWWALLAVAVLLGVLAARERQRARRFVLVGALLAAALQLAVGRFNWFHRYEVYALVFAVLIASQALLESTRLHWRTLAIALFAIAWPYELALWETPAAAANVYQQQYQMHRFEADFYRGNVAVNDLGWVSYRRPAGAYVLDLWGLASPEASRQVNKDADWLDTITREHGAGLAMIYPNWYAEGAPDDWQPLATMCVTSPRPSAGLPCVVFYSTGVGDAGLLTTEIAAFARTLPAGVKMTLGRDSTDDDE